MGTRALHRIFSLTLFCLAVTAGAAAAQTPQGSTAAPGLMELTLQDGSRFYGSVEREEADQIIFRVSSGAVLVVSRSQLASMRPVRGRIRDGEFVRTDTHRTRLFFAPTARSLPAGSTSVGVFELYVPFVQAGITDRLSIGGGTPLIFGFDESNRPFWVTPKFQVYDGDRQQVAVGMLHLFNFDGDGVGIAYGVGTFGSEDDALTVGAGMAYSDGSRGGLVMIGGETRPRRNLKVITENYVWRGGGILSAGVRFMGERFSTDLGLAVPFGGDLFVAFPVVNVVYVF